MSTVNDAIADAARQLTAEAKAAGVEVPETEEITEETTETSEETTEEVSEEVEETTDGLSDDEKEEAARLYRALKDPKAAGPIIAALAQQAGILNPAKPAETVKEKKVEAKKVTELLKEGLGKEYEFLADRLGTSIEKILEQERQVQAVQIDALAQENIVREINSTLSSLAKESKGESKKLEARMTELMDEIKPGENVSIDKYLRRIYAIAASEKRPTQTTRQNVERINRNAADVPGRITSSSAVHETATPPKKMNLNEAVAWAAKELTKGKK